MPSSKSARARMQDIVKKAQESGDTFINQSL